jgi:hypothetical protein
MQKTGIKTKQNKTKYNIQYLVYIKFIYIKYKV